jgi:hypothetical protein
MLDVECGTALPSHVVEQTKETLVLREPANYMLCFGHMPTSAADLSVPVGSLLVKGPHDGAWECVLGVRCFLFVEGSALLAAPIAFARGCDEPLARDRGLINPPRVVRLNFTDLRRLLRRPRNVSSTDVRQRRQFCCRQVPLRDAGTTTGWR